MSTNWSGRQARGSRAVKRDVAERQRKRGRLFALAVAVVYVVAATVVAAASVREIRARSIVAPPPGPPVPFAQQARYLVLFVLDGARPDYFDLTSLPHVDALRAQGTQFTDTMDGILETETPSGHAALATGSTPARNGILGFDWAQDDNDYSLFSPDIIRAGAIEHIFESANVPTIAGLYQARFPGARVVALSGHKYYAADPLGGPHADAIMYYQGSNQGTYVPVAIPGHVPPAGVLDAPGVIGPNTHLGDGGEDRLATKLALAAFAKMRQRITLINYPEFDWPVGHMDGGNEDPAKVIKLMKEFDHDLAMIENTFRKAGVLDKTLFVITADHGMSPVKRFIPPQVLRDAVARAGTTAPAMATNTAAYLWLGDAAKSEAAARALWAERDRGIQSVYYRSTVGGKVSYVRAGGSLISGTVAAAERFLLQTLINGHEPDVVAFCRAGQSFASAAPQWRADHGGANWQSQHIPLILAGPGIRQGQVIADPATLIDVAPTILTAMGVKPTGMQGDILTDALDNSTRRADAARQAEIRQITPLVNALIAQDDYESGK